MNLGIRHGQTDDIPACVALINQANNKSENYKRPINEKMIYNHLAVRMMNPYSLVLVNDDVSGLLIAAASEHYFFNHKVANEFFYAEKDGLRFIRAYKKWAKNWGPETMIDMCLSYSNDERARKVFEHEGFFVIGPQMRLK